MPSYVLIHQHRPEECRYAFAAWRGFGSPLRHQSTPGSCVEGGHRLHLGRLAASGDPRGRDCAGELTPIIPYAEMFSGWGLRGLDGTAWYHPQRLTLDSQSVAAGDANPAQQVLGVRATHGDDLSRRLRIYAFGALGGERILDAARALATQSGIPARNVVLVNRQGTYAHNDPNSASPRNDFVARLIPFLRRVARG